MPERDYAATSGDLAARAEKGLDDDLTKINLMLLYVM